MPAMADDPDNLRAELEAARAEIKDLRWAVVQMCDTYSANRAEKQKVKVFRAVAMSGDAPFAAAVNAALGQLEQREVGAEETDDLKERLSLLAAASRPTELATDKSGPTIQGHVIGAITKIKRELERRMMGGGK